VSTPATILSTAAGVVLIGFAARDIFDALFHPEGRGTFARMLMHGVWSGFRRLASGPRSFPLAGPVALIIVIATWASLLALGWALVFWPQFPGGFHIVKPSAGGHFLDAVNVSLVSLTTLGFGDIVPHEGWLRLAVPLEALLGFGLLSASISWLLLIYPVLSRRRSLAYEISLLRQAERRSGLALERLEAGAAERVYAELTSRLVAIERDLVNFPIAYYFTEGDERFALPAVAPYLLDLARRGTRPAASEPVRLRARLLMEAIEDLARTTADRFHGVRGSSTEEVLEAYARDHMRVISQG
jgi:hypothetical protein